MSVKRSNKFNSQLDLWNKLNEKKYITRSTTIYKRCDKN